MGCFLGMHDWVVFGGPVNLGNGKFKKRFKCRKCGKIKEEIH